jgi:hypothetical protein
VSVPRGQPDCQANRDWRYANTHLWSHSSPLLTSSQQCLA